GAVARVAPVHDGARHVQVLGRAQRGAHRDAELGQPGADPLQRALAGGEPVFELGVVLLGGEDDATLAPGLGGEAVLDLSLIRPERAVRTAHHPPPSPVRHAVIPYRRYLGTSAF